MTGTLTKSAIAAAFAAAIGVALLSPAGAASNVQVTLIDCESHPRRIAFQNTGDTAQNLTSWKLLSDKPNEVFDLGVVGSVAAGDVFYVFNGHQAPLTPQPPIWPWNPTEVYDESAFVLSPATNDFIRVVDATGFPWREVSNMPCEDATEIPPLEQPATPTPAPSGDNTGGDPNQPQTNQPDDTQTSGSQQSTANPDAANNAARSGAATAAQSGNVSDQLAGGPSSGVGVLSPAGGGPPFAGPLLPLGLLGVGGSAALVLLALRMMRRARRP